jgi:hypothetical protein
MKLRAHVEQIEQGKYHHCGDHAEPHFASIYVRRQERRGQGECERNSRGYGHRIEYYDGDTIHTQAQLICRKFSTSGRKLEKILLPPPEKIPDISNQQRQTGKDLAR